MTILVINPAKTRYTEAGQRVETRYAFLKKDKNGAYVQLFRDVMCRDYLSDVLIAEYYKKNLYVYGFTTDYSAAIDRKNTLLSVNYKAKSTSMSSFLTKGIHFLNEIEDKNGVQRTEVLIPENSEEHLIIKGDTFWQNTTQALHLYTFLIRVFSTPDLKDNWIDVHEIEFIRPIKVGLKNILEGHIKEFFVPAEGAPSVFKEELLESWYEENVYMIHTYGGVQSFLRPENSNIKWFTKNTPSYNEMLKKGMLK